MGNFLIRRIISVESCPSLHIRRWRRTLVQHIGTTCKGMALISKAMEKKRAPVDCLPFLLPPLPTPFTHVCPRTWPQLASLKSSGIDRFCLERSESKTNRRELKQPHTYILACFLRCNTSFNGAFGSPIRVDSRHVDDDVICTIFLQLLREFASNNHHRTNANLCPVVIVQDSRSLDIFCELQ